MRVRISLAAAFVLSLALPAAATAERICSAGRLLTPEKAAAQKARTEARIGEPFGVDATMVHTLGPCDANPRAFDLPFSASDCEVLVPAQVGPTLAAFPLHLPAGAKIMGLFVTYYDTMAIGEPSLGLYEASEGTLSLITDFPMPTVSTGLNFVNFVLGAPYQVDNTKTYVIDLVLDSDASTYQGIYSISVNYLLQVSPAPATASFTDVPTNHPFFQFVEALASSGITVGCGGGNFCPNQPLTRGQMAVFLAKALGLHFAF